MERREFLQAVSAGAAVATIGSGTAVARALSPKCDEPEALPGTEPGTGKVAPKEEEQPVAPAPWWLLSPWGRGSHIAFGWHLQNVSPVIRGGFELVLVRADETRARVAACRAGSNARGVARNDSFDLVLVNFGAGDRTTDESLARVVTVLAAVMRQNAKAGEQSSLAEVFTYEQRVHRFGEGVLL